MVNRPLGHKLGTSTYEGVLTNSAGDALITVAPGVAPVSNSYIYIESTIERYNGYVQITLTSSETFKIQRDPDGDFIQWIQDAELTFMISLLEHSWQSVHLPIVYELESNLYPTNIPEEAGTRVILSFSNSNGYVQLLLSEPLDKWDTLEYINLLAAAGGPLAGVYQIVNGIDSENVVIDLAYDGSYDLGPYSVVGYFNNYCINVSIISGLMSGHRWDDEKPSRIIGTLKLTPDSNNRVKFSIADMLKGDIKLRNNPMLDTQPNNLDFYTQFYVSYFETYDEAVDGEIVVYEGEATSDGLIGNAVNSMMPFKSIYQSFMSEYLYVSTIKSRWLTLQDVPLAVVGYYFDLSFLLQESAGIDVTINKQLNGSVIDTEVVSIANPGTGVIRVPIDIESGFDKYCVKVSTSDSDDSPAMTSFENSGAGISWTLGSSPSVVVNPSTSSKILYIDYPFLQFKDYLITVYYDYNATGFAFTSQTRVGVYTSGDVLLGSNTDISPTSGSGSATNVLNYTAITDSDRLGITAFRGPTVGTFTVTVTSVTIQSLGSDIVEEICINIITDACENTMVQDNLRITEDGIFRELE